MLSISDAIWATLKGGYRVPYDASVPLRRLEEGEDVWEELWQELHHQGDVGEASYASVPHLVRIAPKMRDRNWNFYGLISTIEIERHRKTNPPLPAWLVSDYEIALSELVAIAVVDLKNTSDQLTARSILGAIALAKGDIKLGALISHSDDSEIDAILEQYDSWPQLYR